MMRRVVSYLGFKQRRRPRRGWFNNKTKNPELDEAEAALVGLARTPFWSGKTRVDEL
jgi:hypothetical protein